MIPCVWYVSASVQPWEREVIGGMASALRARDVPLTLCSSGGLAAGGESWDGLTGLERAGRVLFSGSLWHLWGRPPVWWGLIRLRARTIHTSFDEKPIWRGHPSRLFPAPTPWGEALLLPTFTSRLQAAQSGPHVAGPDPLDALRAAALTLRGLVAVGLPSPYLDATLGPDGYIQVPQDEEESWLQAMATAEAEEGRRRSAAARHFIKIHFSPAQSADSLLAAYREVARTGK